MILGTCAYIRCPLRFVLSENVYRMSQTRSGFLSGMVAGFVFSAAPASAATATVSIGVVGSTSEIPLFIADKLGYFGAENIVPTYTMFDSAAEMIAPLGRGQLDVAAGGPSASLYNAVGRGVDLRIVADKGSTPKGYGYMMLLLRKDLAGKFRGPADLKGLKIGESASGTIAAPALARYLAQASLKYSTCSTSTSLFRRW
jgi:NitT/TauT family transport system substrate-binding protein